MRTHQGRRVFYFNMAKKRKILTKKVITLIGQNDKLIDIDIHTDCIIFNTENDVFVVDKNDLDWFIETLKF